MEGWNNLKLRHPPEGIKVEVLRTNGNREFGYFRTLQLLGSKIIFFESKSGDQIITDQILFWKSTPKTMQRNV